MTQEPGLATLLRGGEFTRLLVRLGWDHPGTFDPVEVDGKVWRLLPQAQKRDVPVLLCPPDDEGQIPDRPTRLRIEKRVARLALEHIIVYVDAPKTMQVWQWVKREPGKPDRPREHTLHPGQTGEALLQRLQSIAFSLDQEATLGLVDVTAGIRAAFDVDRITRRFYDQFQVEHKVFLDFIDGISEQGDREWYASVMLNRLMFVYFIQKKRFLADDPDYLRHRLDMVRRSRGPNEFQSFYRYFLLRLFHEGLGQQKASREQHLESLLGDVPYLNGGLFDPHLLEQRYEAIDIPDDAFARVFDFFDEWEWTLDIRPNHPDNEINPDVLGYIFEKYINQKQMGAYYTKEDITGYITTNTVIPVLLDRAREQCRIAFDPEGSLWRLLRENPDRYIHDAVLKGVDLPLPENIVCGIDDISLRADWNAPAAVEHALPTEIWREHLTRRERAQDLRRKLSGGEVSDLTQLVTLNLNLVQFIQDAIDGCEGPELLRGFYKAIRTITVLDPTCGSGAFLFAALNLLQPLYDACLDRMKDFVGELRDSNDGPREVKFSDFRTTLADVERHPSRDYFVLKRIILNNLYGVDLMEEAVEICKLRLFLKLVAGLQSKEQIEPLPDIDFNIRAGNTLVGFATYEEAERVITSRFDFDNVMPQIREQAEDVDRLAALFREQQTDFGGDVTQGDKADLQARLAAVNGGLNGYLATAYGRNPDEPRESESWLKLYRPFHWWTEFYGIMHAGGFDAVIGNPPYIVYPNSAIPYRLRDDLYRTISCRNLYAFTIERSTSLLTSRGRLGLIVQLTVMSSEQMGTLQDLLAERHAVQLVPFPRRPESVFAGVEMPVVIVLSLPGSARGYATTNVNRFYSNERPHVLKRLMLASHVVRVDGFRIAKAGTDIDVSIVQKLLTKSHALGALAVAGSPHCVYYQEACRYWMKARVGAPFFKRNGEAIPPPHGRTLSLESGNAAFFVACILNSSLFYWYYSLLSDCEHVNDGLVRGFPIPEDWASSDWAGMAVPLQERLDLSSTRKRIRTKQGHTIEYDELNASAAKKEMDAVDSALASVYGLSAVEFDHLISFDIKYRMGDALAVTG